MNDQMQFTEVNERSRTYVFPNDQRYTVSDVKRIYVRPTGTHRLEDGNGKKYIVPAGWIAVEIDVDHWTF